MDPDDLGPCVTWAYQRDDGQQTLDDCGADVLACVADGGHVEGVVDEVVGEECVDVDDEQAEHGGEDQLRLVVGDGLDDVLQGLESVLGEGRLR